MTSTTFSLARRSAEALLRTASRRRGTYWRAWIACGLLMTLPAAAQADIFRWDNGQLIPGTQGITPGPGVDLSRWSSPERNLRFADFSGGLDLTQANFSSSWLDNSRFNGANLTRCTSICRTLTNANLSGTNLTDAWLRVATLTNANFAGAVVAGANFDRLVDGQSQES